MNDHAYHNVLTVDTSSNVLRLVLKFGVDRTVRLIEDVAASHGQMLVRKIQDLFVSADLSIDQLDAIVVCTGPGSFTGLRVGLAAVKGMAEALSIPVVGVSLFEIAAVKLLGADGPVCVVLPFKRDACFVATVDSGRFDPESMEATPWVKLGEFLGGRSATGIGVDLPPGLSTCASTIPVRIEYDAADLLHVGTARLEVGDHDDISRLQPLYVLKSKAELRYEQRRKNR